MELINQSEYKTLDFLHRLKLVQSVILKNELDALLLINGSDGLNNKENAKIINWLFKGNNGSIIESDTYLDALFEESFVIISREGLSLFGSDTLFKSYFDFFIAIVNRELAVYKEEDAENDRDRFEMHKIKEFYRLIEKHKSIGMLLADPDAKSFKKSIEDIPLIESYGLDG